MWTNAWAARSLRCSKVNPPPCTAANTDGYAAGSTTTATLGWFLAAARTIEGPPMSMFSTTWSWFAPEATVSRKG